MRLSEYLRTSGIGKAGESYNIDPRVLEVIPGWNSRDMSDPENIAHIEGLTRSIMEVGLKEPLIVRFDSKNNKVYVVGGHMRLAAIMKAIALGYPAKTVRCIVDDQETGEEEQIAEQIVRNTGKQFTHLEQGVVFRKLLAAGWDREQIAAKTGKDILTINNILSLEAAPMVIKNTVKSGEIAATTAEQVIREEGNARGKEIIEKAVKIAKSQGKAKATPRHIEEARTGVAAAPITRTRRDKTPVAPPSGPIKARYTHDNAVDALRALKAVLEAKTLEGAHTIAENILESFGLLEEEAA